jgi:hypothetical protein
MIYSFRDDTYELRYHKKTGHFAFLIERNGDVVFESARDDGANLYLIHGWLMWTAWGILGFV